MSSTAATGTYCAHTTAHQQAVFDTGAARPLAVEVAEGRRDRLPRSRLALTLAALMAVSPWLSGCASGSMSERQQGTAKGAAIGGLAGAVLGSVTGGRAGTGAVVGGVVGAVAGNLWSKRMEDKRAALANATTGTGIEVARTPDNQLKLNVPSDFSFAVGRADVKPEMRPVLDEIARNLDATVHITVVGHTDNTGGEAMNQSLSVDRAASVRSYLGQHGVSSNRIAVEGRGEREPLASNASESGRASNRRVEIFLVERGA